jgi:hypothetical protein
MDKQIHFTNPSRRDATALQFLHPDQIEMIDDALTRVGDYGEVHLVVEKGKLRFIVINTSVDVRNWKAQITNLRKPDSK